ncbi:unnamed protein product [Hydatigera taeniaeformis]|uniref:Ribosome production factor 2 homolog n=1 Tax=Hydatigena taeniaeformis TaxID=6205 RepID=A0A0R3XBP1_HYDTA|nr:unnamed protein product [Hydatigera taeniaeformis]
MATDTLERQVKLEITLILAFSSSAPKTHRGRKFLSKREPQIHENDKQTLIIRGTHTGEIVNSFLTDIFMLKKPLVNKLRWKNRVLPFEDATFIVREHMCNKYDCSLFVMGTHSKKRPNNIVIGRLYDHEILDMHELGIEKYVSMHSVETKLPLGSKPILIFSGEAFDEDGESKLLKSVLIDLFRGPKVSCINSSGLEYVIHFLMPEPRKLFMRVLTIKLEELKKPSKDEHVGDVEQLATAEALKTPWGPYVHLRLCDSAPDVDFVLRRHQMPSEDKWKRSLRVPPQLWPKRDKPTRNRSVDVYGSKVAQIHLQREHTLDKLRPGSSMRTALTGRVKRGFERQPEPNKARGGKKRKMVGENVTSAIKTKRQKLNL